MSLDGKENQEPNPPIENILENAESNVIKSVESILNDSSSSATATVTAPTYAAAVSAQKPLLFSEIVFKDVRGEHFSLFSTGPGSNDQSIPASVFDPPAASPAATPVAPTAPTPTTTTNTLSENYNFFEAASNMNGIFNNSFTGPGPNVFGAIGSQLPTNATSIPNAISNQNSNSTSNSSSPTSGGEVNPEQFWLMPTDAAVMASISPTNDFVAQLQQNTNNAFLSANTCGRCDVNVSHNYCFDCRDNVCNYCMLMNPRCRSHFVQPVKNLTEESGQVSPPQPPQPNTCDIHHESLRYVCPSCKIIVCQECSMRDHKDHDTLSVDAYIERIPKTIIDLMAAANNGKMIIRRYIDLVIKNSHYLETQMNDALTKIHSGKNLGRASIIYNNAARKYGDGEFTLSEILAKYRAHKSSRLMDQSDSLRTSLAGIAAVTDDLKKIGATARGQANYDVAKLLVESDNKIDHFMKQTAKTDLTPPNVKEFLVRLAERNERQAEQMKQMQQAQTLPQLQQIQQLQQMMPNNAMQFNADLAALVASTNQLNLMQNNANNNLQNGGRPITRSNHTMAAAANPQMMFQQHLPSTSQGHSPWKQMPLRMPSNDVMRIPSNDGLMGNFNGYAMATQLPQQYHNAGMVNFNGFNTLSTLSALHTMSANSGAMVNNEPSGYGQCIFNLETPVQAMRCDVVTAAFAFDGSLEGELSRPWGVCVDFDGHIIVGDRRNNRIQVFYPDGTFKFAFGSKGSGDGELELPAGVTTDRQNRIIVADKDNHRVQVFSATGRFILKFGSYGRDLGEFQYPWDVATNTAGHILVTDTRNHRIQMFTSQGHFITKYTFESYCDRHLKSHITPRGVCFTPNGDVLVTDFENHRIMKLDSNISMIKAVRGHEGDGEIHEFNRPSGLCCDDKNQVVIADSKNQRVLVYDTDFNFKWQLDLRRTLTEANNEKDRPSDVAVLPDGRIVVLFETSPDTKDFPNPLKTFIQIY